MPSICLFEIALLIERGRLRAAPGLDGWIAASRAAPGLVEEGFLPEDARLAASLPQLVDPFDRMIVGTALRLGVPLLTADARITDSGAVRVVWA